MQLNKYIIFIMYIYGYYKLYNNYLYVYITQEQYNLVNYYKLVNNNQLKNSYL